MNGYQPKPPNCRNCVVYEMCITPKHKNGVCELYIPIPPKSGSNITKNNEVNYKMKLKIKLDDGAKMPTRAHEADAGLDIYSRSTTSIMGRGSATFDTGVHIEIPKGYVGFLKSKSGLNVKYGITSEGVIDSGYTGSIVVKLYNSDNAPYIVREGDKISQLVILPIITPDLEQVEHLEETERGNNGFGSSGK